MGRAHWVHEGKTLSRSDEIERDLWLLAIGCCLSDETLRERLVGDPPRELRPLVEALQERNPEKGWLALERWGVRKNGSDKPAGRVLAALEDLERRKRRMPLLEQMRSALAAGAEDMYQAKLAELERLK